MVKAAKQKKRSPKQPKKILVPIDFSASAKSAFRHAIGLAGDASRIILLHVIAPSGVKGSDVTHLIAAAEASLTSFSKSDGLDHDHAAHSLVRIGTPFSEILAAAAENDVELIVLGVHDSAPLRGLALGHTAERVSRYAPCPVMLVRESKGDRAVSKSAAAAAAPALRR